MPFGGNPYCRIRLCAKAKKVELCAFCEEYPCEESERAFSAYPMLKEDNLRLRENGPDAWLEMQKERKRDGYTYTDAKDKPPQNA